MGRGEESQLGAELLAASLVEDGEVEPAGETVEHLRHVGEGVVNFRHVPLHHHMGQSAGAAEGFDVLVGALGMAAVSQRQRSIEEQVTGLGAHGHEFSDGETIQGGSGGSQLGEVFFDDTGIHGRDDGTDFSGAEIFDLRLLREA